MEGLKYTDVMIDLETTGTMPDRTAIIQISAVKFNLETREVDPNFFDRCLSIPPHRFWDQSTAAWWAKQKPSTLRDILARQEDPRIVITDFAKWAYQTPKLRFWSKPTTFDFMFLSSYFNDEGLANPFHYSMSNQVNYSNDLNSFLTGLHYPNKVPEIAWTAGGSAHNALDDTLNQLKWLFDHLDYKANGVMEAEFTDVSNPN